MKKEKKDRKKSKEIDRARRIINRSVRDFISVPLYPPRNLGSGSGDSPETIVERNAALAMAIATQMSLILYKYPSSPPLRPSSCSRPPRWHQGNGSTIADASSSLGLGGPTAARRRHGDASTLAPANGTSRLSCGWVCGRSFGT